MRYLDQYVRMAVEKFEGELARVAQFDKQAKTFSESEALSALLSKIKNGEVSPPSHEFDGFSVWFIPDDRYGTPSWASDLYYKKGVQNLAGYAATLAYTLRNFHNDLEFADDCRLSGYTFPDGWPDNPELFAETVRQVEQEAAAQAKIKLEQSRFSFKLKSLWQRLFKRSSTRHS